MISPSIPPDESKPRDADNWARKVSSLGECNQGLERTVMVLYADEESFTFMTPWAMFLQDGLPLAPTKKMMVR